MDPIIAATWSDDGAVGDVCKALIPRLREPNSVVRLLPVPMPFHIDSIWGKGGVQSSYSPSFNDSEWFHRQRPRIPLDCRLSAVAQRHRPQLGRCVSGDIQRCAVPDPHLLAGYSAPENVQHYALYLDSRIRAYRDLKHDAIRVQSDTNRDVRNSMIVDPDASTKSKKHRHNEPQSAALSRSKTMAGRKLRSMTVEKGLLRETRIVQTMIDALVECRVSVILSTRHDS